MRTRPRLGALGVISRDDEEDVVQLYLYGAAAARIGTSDTQIRELLRLVRGVGELERTTRDAMCWEVFDSLLAATPTVPAVDAACRAGGVPIIGGSGKSIKESYEVLSTLAKFISSTGLNDAIDQMKSTNAAQTRALSASLDALQRHLASKLLSPTAFETAPSLFFRSGTPIPGLVQRAKFRSS